MTMASGIDVCTPFSRCEKDKALQVFLLFCLHLWVRVHACVCVYMCVCAVVVVEQLPGLIII